MKLSNDFLRSVIVDIIGIGPGNVIRVKDIWLLLYKKGYRENMIRFLEVLEVRFPKEPFVDPGTLAEALGATDGFDHNETKFRIAEFHIVPADPTSEQLSDKGKYEIQCYGHHYIIEKEKFAEKETMIFSLRLE